MSLNRRQLIVGAAAASCVGCSSVVDMEAVEQVAPVEQVDGAAEVAETDAPGQGLRFGSDLHLGTVDQVLEKIRDNDGFWYVPEGRAWLTEYPADSLDQARAQYSARELAAMEAGFVALYQKCPHLGCRVPSCFTSEMFECPCHGSEYNQAGEKRRGPSPRGMDRFGVWITDQNEVVVITSLIIQGPPIGTDTTGQERSGPNCITAATE